MYVCTYVSLYFFQTKTTNYASVSTTSWAWKSTRPLRGTR